MKSNSKTLYLKPSARPSSRGFTLIETLVAVLIFSIALVSLITIATKGLSSTKSSRTQTVAHYLAQEGIEFTRNIRDRNFIQGSHWLNTMPSCEETNGCDINYDDFVLYANCGTGCPLYFNTTKKVYTFESGGAEPTPFTRIIYFEEIGDTGSEVRVTSSVSWTDGSIPRAVTLSEHIFNWY